MARPPLLALVGPTASGKTEAAIDLAERLGAEIVSVDSMLVYRGMDVGTAKPGPEERARIPHHLIDVAAPQEPFSVSRYQVLARAAVAGIAGRGARPLLAGGSGLYFRAVVDDLEFPGTDPTARGELEAEAAALGAGPLHARLRELDPVAAAKIEPANVRRTVRALEVAAVTGRPFSAYAESWEGYPEDRVRAAGISIPRDVLNRRIEARVGDMVEAGFVEEVEGLVERGFAAWLTATRAIGYAEMTRHLEGVLSLDDAMAGTVRRTKALARRQLAWFRRDPRIRWFEAGEEGAGATVSDLQEFLSGD
ncbi:MAG: tRNA (adenosine(37)-N6)-dimethylallyltransferase MiaA [Actinomycetota bacterium]